MSSDRVGIVPEHGRAAALLTLDYVGQEEIPKQPEGTWESQSSRAQSSYSPQPLHSPAHLQTEEPEPSSQ